MKGSLVADEMFPEGAGPYMDIDEVKCLACMLYAPSPFTVSQKNCETSDFLKLLVNLFINFSYFVGTIFIRSKFMP